MIKGLTIPWALLAKAGIAAAVFAAGMGAGATVQGLRQNAAHMEAVTQLAACRGADAEASRKTLERATRTMEANAVRQSDVTGQLIAGAEAFRELQETPREVSVRLECIGAGDDERRMQRIDAPFAAAGEPVHRD